MNSQWLNALFKTHPEKTKKSLADFLGLEPPAISKILNGARQIKAEEYIGMRAFFGLSQDGGHAVVSQYQPYTALVGDQKYTLGEEQHADKQWMGATEILAQNSNIVCKRAMIIENADDYMAPDFEKGQLIVVDLDKTQPEAGKLEIFVVSDGVNYMIRECKLVHESAATQIKVSAKKEQFTPQTLKIEDIHILGRVVGKVIAR